MSPLGAQTGGPPTRLIDPSAVVPRQRLLAFDTIRGFFIAVIATVHLAQNLEPSIRAQPALRAVLELLVGTVGFVTVSGIFVGYFFETRPGEGPVIIARYRKHAIRLLLIAHPLIVLALYGWKGGPRDQGIAFLWRSWFVTDTLAVLFLCVVPLVARLRLRTRLALGILLLVAGRLLFVLRPGGSTLSFLVDDILAGPDLHVRHVLNEDYPLLSLAGMFLIGSSIGRDVAGAFRAQGERPTASHYLRWVPLLLLITVDLLGLWAILRHGPQGRLRAFLYPDYCLSTYPLYLATVLALMGVIGYRPSQGAIGKFLAAFGRTSLFTYVVQYYVMQTLPFLVGWRRHMTLPVAAAYLAGGIVLLNVIARTYERVRSRRGHVPTLMHRPSGG